MAISFGVIDGGAPNALEELYNSPVDREENANNPVKDSIEK